ncbi:MAG: NIPSNAP family protein [Gammaproteobacteria bacterium]|nr:NIPSNAP family protein [Gammaproteobacteria bacterium]
MIYEMRRYDCMPGQIGILHKLMEELAIPIFERLGMTFVGAWTPEVGDDENCLIYILSYSDMGVRQKAWNDFWVDPEWIEGRGKYGKLAGGPIVSKSNSMFLSPAGYSPLK